MSETKWNASESSGATRAATVPEAVGRNGGSVNEAAKSKSKHDVERLAVLPAVRKALTKPSSKVATIATASYTVIAFLVGILDFLSGGDTWKRLPILLVVAGVSVVGVWLYYAHFGINIPRWRYLILFLIPIVIGLSLSLAYYLYSYRQIDAAHIAPELRRPFHKLPTTSTYGSNSKIVENQVYSNTKSADGPKYFLRLRIQMYCKGQQDDCDGGWILSNLSGYDASKFSRLEFEARSLGADAHFGVGIKDSNDTEVKLPNINEFLSAKLTSDWTNLAIDLIEFKDRNLNLSAIENVSLYVDAQNTDQRLIEFEAGNFRFE